MTRRALLGAFAATAVTAAPTYSNAAGFLRGGGDIRRIKMYSGRTGERIDMIYWIEGKYIKEAVKEVNYFMRDWRTDGVKNMDLRTVDIQLIDRPPELITHTFLIDTNKTTRSCGKSDISHRTFTGTCGDGIAPGIAI